MGKPRLEPLLEVHFKCPYCGHNFNAAPDRVEDANDRPWHPFSYFSRCPRCGNTAEQSGRERGLLKAWAHATGPRTAEGIAAVTKNIEGHPTPAEAQQTRFNAVKTGVYAKTMKYFPARPGAYAICDSCHYRGVECVEGNTEFTACLRRVELFMRNQAAFDARDPSILMQDQAARQAALAALIDEMIMVIAADGGPRIKSLEWYYDKDGGFHLARYRDDDGDFHQIYKIEEHPLLKRLMEFISKNNMTMADLGMTPKVQDEQDLLRGYLDNDEDQKEKTGDYIQRLEHQQNELMKLINDSYEPVTIEDGKVVGDG